MTAPAPDVDALALVEWLQARFVAALSALAPERDAFRPVTWVRHGGATGGGTRLATGDGAVFDRASVNVSQVTFTRSDAAIRSATALSTIVHPRHPRCPSFHAHVSYTVPRDGAGTWRLMADLNPSLPEGGDIARFVAALAPALGVWLPRALRQGDAYFWIPALERHRGVAHAYLEGHATGSEADDRAFARGFGERMLDAYAAILGDAVRRAGPADAEELAVQRHYHTLYFLQVLTLDRGTTSGLLAHDQNDVGTLGSLPSRVDPDRLRSWRERVPALQRPLLDALIDALPADGRVEDPVKAALAAAVRAHYAAHPEALALQAASAPAGGGP